jgi:VCBS repeat protein/fibronectin type III domain protein
MTPNSETRLGLEVVMLLETKRPWLAGILITVVLVLLGCETDLVPPGEVSALSVLAVEDQADVTWTDPSDEDFDHVVIAWEPGGSELQTVAAGVQTYTVAGLTKGTAYGILVCTVDATGNVSGGSLRVAVPGDDQAPGEVGSLSADPSPDDIILTWADPADDDLDHIEISWPPNSDAIQMVSPDVEVYQLTELPYLHDYRLVVRTVDTSGNHSDGSPVLARTNQILHQIDDAFEGSYCVRATDLDEDGDVDVLGAAFAGNAISWWENSDDGTTWTEHGIATSFSGAMRVVEADIDGDTHPDVVATAYVGDAIYWWKNTAGDASAWDAVVVDSSVTEAGGLCVGDFDGNDDLDIAATSIVSPFVSWWNNTAGDGSVWTRVAVSTTFGLSYGIHAANVDGDGDIDLIGASQLNQDISWFENTAGDGSAWTERVVSADFSGPFSVLGVDLDGDDDVDILGAGAAGYTWWENTLGDGSLWEAHQIGGSHSIPSGEVHAADMDGDGDMDVLGNGGSIIFGVHWWENLTGDGSAWEEHSIGPSANGCAVHAGDLDGDGDVDIIRSVYSQDNVGWWEL